jgi:hypothetical protein
MGNEIVDGRAFRCWRRRPLEAAGLRKHCTPAANRASERFGFDEGHMGEVPSKPGGFPTATADDERQRPAGTVGEVLSREP